MDITASADAANRMLRRAADGKQDMRQRMLVLMNHELRTPLAIMALSSHLMRDSLSCEPGRKAFAYLQNATEKLAGNMNRLMLFVHLNSGHGGVSRQPLALESLVRAAASKRAEAASARGVRLAFSTACADSSLQGDPELLEGAIIELVDNGLASSRAGGKIGLSLRSAGGGVELSATDDGCGVPPEKLASLFSPFYQTEASITRARGGLGLGLALVRLIVEAHGGKVSARNNPSRGMTFSIWIPRPAQPLYWPFSRLFKRFESRNK